MIRLSRPLHKVAAAALATVALGLSAGALAQAKPAFESLDKNGDGKISLNEASANDTLFVAFKGLDTDKDGELTREEFAKHK